MHIRPFILPAMLCSVPAVCLAAGPTVTVTGHGVSPVDPKEKKVANENALRRAREAAKVDAFAQMVADIYGTRDKLGPKADEIIQQIADRAADKIRDQIPKREDILDGKAIVDIEFKIDRNALQDWIKKNMKLSLTGESRANLSIYVLTYTAEGMDANRSQKTVLFEEDVSDQKNVQARSFANSSTDANSRSNSSASSLQASASRSEKGDAKYDSSARIKASAEDSGSVRGSESGSAGISTRRGSAAAEYQREAEGKYNSERKLDAQRSDSGAASWDNRQAASVDARTASSSAASNFQQRAASGSSYSDTSTFTKRIRIYADPTRKDVSGSNDVKTVISGMLSQKGLKVQEVMGMKLEGREFPGEEALREYIITEMRKNPDVNRDNFVAIAINCLTPLPGNGPKKFTSAINYSITRISDGTHFLPAKTTSVTSDPSDSDSIARMNATEMAIRKVDRSFSEEVDQALKDWEDESARKSASASVEYVITIDNAGPAAGIKLQQALATAGFASPVYSYNGPAKLLKLTVPLRGKKGEDALMAILPHVEAFDTKGVVDNTQANLRVK